ncbi:acyltransferase family protein [Ideonella sp. BN130291]|uniref:acyltransferase family protein n=1 Tax=Ideonella sp. BN130291 TaxID=3112940 RepID=UPI002E2681D4|nr:acyltransferase family protein [Ideonella sp. BN130291]
MTLDHPPPAHPHPGRLTELDWLRIAAFGLLILYHVGMFYVSWDWHVKSPRLVPELEALMRLSSPWRMSLLFVVSGAATALMAGAGRPLAGPRTLRLLPPLLFGMAVVVPPQAYLEVVEKVAYAGSYADFMRLYVQGYHGFCRGSDCLVLPTWNHLWFVAYLWVYTMVLALVLRTAGTAWRDAGGWGWLSHGGRLLWAPWLLFALARILLVARFPTTHDLLHDAYNHVLYGAMFLLGFVLFGRADDAHGAWAAAVRLRWWALAVALAAMVVSDRWSAAYAGPVDPSDTVLMALRALNAVKQWAPIVALLGFARRHLAGRDGATRRWLTEGIFPFYILHQTVIVVAAHLLARAALPLALEALLLVAITAAACVLGFEAVRRVPWLRPLFGLAPRAGRQPGKRADGQPVGVR